MTLLFASVNSRSLETDDAKMLAFLGETERTDFGKLRFPRRRREWLAGRLLSKVLFAQYQGVPCKLARAPEFFEISFEDIFECLEAHREVRVEVRTLASGAPCLANQSCFLSISHRSDRVFACLGQHQLGLDFEIVEEKDENFYRHCFSDMERQWMDIEISKTGRSKAWLSCLLWTFKEAFVKLSTHAEGFALNARQVEVALDAISICTLGADTVMLTARSRVRRHDAETLVCYQSHASAGEILSLCTRSEDCLVD